MEITFTKQKIDEAFEVALELGLCNASKTEQELFYKYLSQIAVSAIDETRIEIGELMFKKSNQYTSRNAANN